MCWFLENLVTGERSSRNLKKSSKAERLILDMNSVIREKQLPIYHLGTKVGVYQPDLLVNNLIIIELKAKPFLHPDDIKQFWYYLKNSEFKLVFLVNFV